MTPTEALDTLRDALPADPDDHGPIGVPSDAVRAVLAHTDLATRTLDLVAQLQEADDD